MRFLLASVIFSWAISCEKEVSREVGPPILPDKVLTVAVLVRDSVNQAELNALVKPFQLCAEYSKPGVIVFAIAEKPTGSGVTGFSTRYSFTSDSLPPIDILLVPGSTAITADLANTSIKDFLSDTRRKALYMVSVGNGTFLLAQAGILEGRKSMISKEEKSAFKKLFPAVQPKANVDFVHDHTVITAAGGAKAHEPALYLVELLYGKEAADSVAAKMNLPWDLSAVSYTRQD